MSFTPEQDHTAMLTFMLGHPYGRAYVWKALEACGVYRATFAGERPLVTAFNEGRRNIGLALLNDILAFDANALTVMQAEDTERQQRYHVRAQERDDEL